MPQEATVHRLRGIVNEAARAVDAGRGDAFRAQWASRPSTDREAEFALATLARVRYDYPEAERRYHRLLPRERGPQNPLELYALLGRARMHSQRSELAASSVAFTESAAAARRLGDRQGEAEAWISLVPQAVRTAGPDSAHALLDRAEGLLAPADTVLLAAARCTRLIAFRFGRAATGDSLAPAAIALARAARDPRLLGRCYLYYSQVLEAIGLQSRSQLVLDTARSILDRDARDDEAMAAVQQFTTYRVVRYQATFDAAVRTAGQAIEHGRRSGNQLAVGWTLLNLAQLALRLDDARAAGRYVAESRQIFERVGDRLAVPNVRVVEGDAANTLGHLTQARAAYQDAVDGFRELGFSSEFLLFRLAGVAREMGRLDEGTDLLDQAVASARQRGFRGLLNDQLYERGVFALRRGGYDEAATLFRQFMTAAGGGPAAQVDANLRLAEALTLAGRLDEAERVLSEGLLGADSIRAYLRTREGQVVALQSRRYEFDPDLGVATIVAGFARRGRIGTAFRIAEALKARFLWAQVVRRGALGGDTAGPMARRVDRITPPPVALSDVQRSLPDSTTLLEFITGRGGEPTTLFAVSRTRAMVFDLPPADSVLAEIGRFATAVEGGTRPRALARRLTAALLDSAIASLPSGIRVLAIVPDGPFHRLPFDALDLADGRPLLERFTTVLAPSARLLQAWWAAPGSRVAGRMVSVGDPRLDPATKLAALPASGREATAIARLSGNADVLLGPGASEAALKRLKWSDVRMLHLATHAEVEDYGVMSSALYLTPGEGEDGRLGVAEIAALPLDLDLVVLSACRTLGGDVVTGEGLQGLTAPFIEAGARAVVATYWPIGDRSIVPLLTRFYKELGSGAPAAEALRRAKLASLHAGDPPSVWAAFSITGDGWVRPRLH